MLLELNYGLSIEDYCLGYYSLTELSSVAEHFKICAEQAAGKEFKYVSKIKDVNGRSYVFLNLVPKEDYLSHENRKK